MTKAGQTILLQRKHMEWIAIGVFAEVEPVVAAVTEFTSAGVSLADLCVAGAPEIMQRVAVALKAGRLDRLASLLHGAVEVRLPGCEGAILAVPSCASNASSFLSIDMAKRLHGPIIDGCILLGASATNAADAAKLGRILLRHSSRHVHMIQSPPVACE